ncbi:MAG: c-type cytochrome biogenesis protein CcmI [Betaproteobacteria bacterium]|nr:MAG: c-type cytochrome biogenesis protein CcmI [Betaproteobacteria bacterium]
MLVFWSLAALLLAVTLALLLRPLLRAREVAAGPDSDAAAISVYRDQKLALDAECADGVITAAERDAAVTELARRLSDEVATVRSAQTDQRGQRRAWFAAAALLLLIPSAAVVLYMRLGNPAAGEPAHAAAIDGRNPHEIADTQIVAMVDSLAQRLKARPDDADGWALLARSYQALGRFPEAADAYAHADALIPDNAALLADYADVLAMAQGRKLAGKPAALAQRALAIDPNHRKALALAATAALEARDLDGALAYWRRLLAQFPQASDDAKQVTAIIAEIESAQREGKGVPVAGDSAPRREARALVTPPAAATIAGRVDISPALATKVALTDTVFIFARAVDGPRVPLAVLRIAAKDLPKEFTLDDSMGMAPGAKLSGAAAVIVEARISRSGNALPQSGDFSGRSAPVKPGAAGVKVVIDQVVP